MARYIDAIKLSRGLARAALRADYGEEVNRIVDIFCKAIMDEPPADVVEVKHGEWIKGGSHYGCSECCTSILYNIWGYECYSDYCPHCGAKMDVRYAE